MLTDGPPIPLSASYITALLGERWDAFDWRPMPRLPKDLARLIAETKQTLARRRRARDLSGHEVESEPAELLALREMADAWEDYSTATKATDILKAQERHVLAVESVRALRKGAGGG